jgi:hypothetical protein
MAPGAGDQGAVVSSMKNLSRLWAGAAKIAEAMTRTKGAIYEFLDGTGTDRNLDGTV